MQTLITLTKSIHTTIRTDNRFVFLIALIAALSISCHRSNPSKDNHASQGIPYQVLEDRMSEKVIIGVPPNVSEEQLRATLSKAADDHQDDGARDYLLSSYLWIEAYLVKDGHRGSVVAGLLKRYVPWENPEVRRKLKTNRRQGDKLTISLIEARLALH